MSETHWKLTFLWSVHCSCDLWRKQHTWEVVKDIPIPSCFQMPAPGNTAGIGRRRKQGGVFQGRSKMPLTSSREFFLECWGPDTATEESSISSSLLLKEASGRSVQKHEKTVLLRTAKFRLTWKKILPSPCQELYSMHRSKPRWASITQCHSMACSSLRPGKLPWPCFKGC